MTHKRIIGCQSTFTACQQLGDMVEEQFDIVIDKEGIDYMRLVRHLRFAIERVVKGKK